MGLHLPMMTDSISRTNWLLINRRFYPLVFLGCIPIFCLSDHIEVEIIIIWHFSIMSKLLYICLANFRMDLRQWFLSWKLLHFNLTKIVIFILLRRNVHIRLLPLSLRGRRYSLFGTAFLILECGQLLKSWVCVLCLNDLLRTLNSRCLWIMLLLVELP